jgi:hypothetical protein
VSFLQRLLPLTPLVLLILIVVGYAVVLRPRFAALRDLRARRGIAAEISAIEQQVSQLSRTRTTFEQQLSLKRGPIDAAVPGGEDVPGLFTALDAAAQRAGVVITTMEATREPAPASLRVLGSNPVILIGLALRSADYARLKSFLATVASSSRLMDVLSVQFAPQAMTATVRIRAYTVE